MNQSANMTSIIKAICKKHNFDYLAADGSTLKIENKPYMPLLITAYGKDTLTVAHYYIQNGDVMYDPEVEFLVVPPERTVNGKEQWFAYCSTQPQIMLMGRVMGGYMPVMELDYSGKFTSPKTIKFKAQASLASFANMWGRNIRQQGFGKVEPAPVQTVIKSSPASKSHTRTQRSQYQQFTVDEMIQKIFVEGTMEQKTQLLERMEALAETDDQKHTINFMKVYFTNPEATEFVNDYVWDSLNNHS